MSDEEEFFDVEDDGDDFHDANERKYCLKLQHISCLCGLPSQMQSQHTDTIYDAAVLPNRPIR